MKKLHIILYFIIIVTSAEILQIVIFRIIGMYKNNNGRQVSISITKGLLERFFLSFCLAINLPIIIAFFGAIKIGTRLDNENKSKVSNDLFLVGNIISVLFAIIYFLVWDQVF